MALNRPKQFVSQLTPQRICQILQNLLGELGMLKTGVVSVALTDSNAKKEEWNKAAEPKLRLCFGENSDELVGFQRALIRDYSIREKQQFIKVVTEQIHYLAGLLEAQKLLLPEPEVKGVYEPGDEYSFYRDLSALIEAASKDVFLIDAYLSEKSFNLFVEKVSDGVALRILSQKLGTGNVHVVASLFNKKHPFELRVSPSIHDRVVFLDDRCWVIGQSMKDAATKKPTYLVELEVPLPQILMSAHETIWKTATAVTL